MNNNTSHRKSLYSITHLAEDSFELKIESFQKRLRLSDIIPIIENLGFIVIAQESVDIKDSLECTQNWIYVFILSGKPDNSIPFDELKYNIEEAFTQIDLRYLDNDALNKLVLLSGLRWYEVRLIKALLRYFMQIGMSYRYDHIQQILIKNYKFVRILVDLFSARFHPNNHSNTQQKKCLEDVNDYLNSTSSRDDDKILRNMALIIQAIVRTNFYQKKQDAQRYLSFKFRSKDVPDLALPHPYKEIFVYSNDFEGIHLRGGKIARGGIRWSDRRDDYRTEVLGLMKSQMTKNTMIVPVGAKGAFYIKIAATEVVTCYKDFLNGLLDITDNIVNGEITQPDRTIVYDESDPYLVVAADKGTASFSDYANSVSQEYNFWLKDSFASGGSLGYDHKKMGITAKGAWVSVQEHFFNIGINVNKDTITVIGIGDMSGDVFGNGMLISQHIKLVAAFNHEHIFIDPNPNCESSYLERKRLFITPRSKWSDYQEQHISQGGGVFSRSAKNISLSFEAIKLLGLDNQNITPEDLIKAILKSDVDLLWNGGIGTYIKSSKESHIDVEDSTNDNLRVNANQVKAKVIAEAGNLGVSQLGRIEYALNGGRINTDFIDNSAGVDCSDHEVNIKIALDDALTSTKITTPERNKTLLQMTLSVEELVLAHNRENNTSITILELSKSVNIDSLGCFLHILESEGLLNRKVEGLPDSAEITKRSLANEGFTRPELSVIFSYIKIYLKTHLSEKELSKNKALDKYLIQYFPLTMQKKLKVEIERHPLREEITSTVLVNKIVQHLPGEQIYIIQYISGASVFEILKSYVIIAELFNLDALWSSINKNAHVELYSDVIEIISKGVIWLLRNLIIPVNIEDALKDLQSDIHKYITDVIPLYTRDSKSRNALKAERYIKSGVPEHLIELLSKTILIRSSLDVVYISQRFKHNQKYVASLYFVIGDLFSITLLKDISDSKTTQLHWDRLTLEYVKQGFYDLHKLLTIEFIKHKVNPEDMESWIYSNHDMVSIFFDIVKKIDPNNIVDLNVLVVANKALEILLHKLQSNLNVSAKLTS